MIILLIIVLFIVSTFITMFLANVCQNEAPPVIVCVLLVTTIVSFSTCWYLGWAIFKAMVRAAQ
jgi:hypothetical protein